MVLVLMVLLLTIMSALGVAFLEIDHPLIVDATYKLERRVRRFKRKIKKKKLFAELRVKTNNLNLRNKKVPSSSLPSDDIQNRNSSLFKEARKEMDIGVRLAVQFRGEETALY